ncbi:MAG: EAL domain-containing protein [Clostridia bacterium]|nr:EAL domain-containing protein [Clostridia bacterium]
MTTDQSYYYWLEQFVHAITRLPEIDLKQVFSALTELCKLFRVCKGVTCFYDNEQKEAEKDGEVFVCYDSGEAGAPVLVKRLVTAANTVVTVTAYQTKEAAPFTDQERERVELILQMILTFMSQDRLKKIIKRMTCYDSDGFRNLQYLFREFDRLAKAGLLSGMAAIHFNLKHFSLINHQFGRPGGSAVMRAYVRRMEQALGENGSVYRLGGDNFVALCRQASMPQLLDCLRGESIAVDCPEPKEVTVSAVAGIFIVPQGFQYRTPGDIMNPITTAYQVAKANRGEDIIYYSEQFDLEKEKVIRIKHAFQNALAAGDLLTYYQPKVQVDSGEIIGAEALCRWRQGGRIVMPMEFIPVLEQGIEICELDFYMLDRVCQDLKRWLERKLRVVPVSVNFSRRHMIDPGLFEHIVEVIDRNGIPHALIDIELTETTTDVEFTALKRLVSQLHQAGISTSVDDFGVGYSSLNLIKEIPWNVLKLDRTLLPSQANRGRGSQMFRHVVALAHEIDMLCVAEGVETPDQLATLRENGCHIAQGFYYDKALPIEAFEQRLKQPYYRK